MVASGVDPVDTWPVGGDRTPAEDSLQNFRCYVPKCWQQVPCSNLDCIPDSPAVASCEAASDVGAGWEAFLKICGFLTNFRGQTPKIFRKFPKPYVSELFNMFLQTPTIRHHALVLHHLGVLSLSHTLLSIGGVHLVAWKLPELFPSF